MISEFSGGTRQGWKHFICHDVTGFDDVIAFMFVTEIFYHRKSLKLVFFFELTAEFLFINPKKINKITTIINN